MPQCSEYVLWFISFVSFALSCIKTFKTQQPNYSLDRLDLWMAEILLFDGVTICMT